MFKTHVLGTALMPSASWSDSTSGGGPSALAAASAKRHKPPREHERRIFTSTPLQTRFRPSVLCGSCRGASAFFYRNKHARLIQRNNPLMKCKVTTHWGSQKSARDIRAPLKHPICSCSTSREVCFIGSRCHGTLPSR